MPRQATFALSSNRTSGGTRTTADGVAALKEFAADDLGERLTLLVHGEAKSAAIAEPEFTADVGLALTPADRGRVEALVRDFQGEG